MNKKNMLIIFGAVALFIALFLGANYIVEKGKLPPPRDSEIQENTLLPLAQDFTLTDLEGKTQSLSDYRGKYVLLNFWTTWCPPCQAEMPDLQEFSQNHKDEIVVLAVNLEEDPAKVKSFIEKRGFTFPVLLDTSGQVGNTYRITNIPASYFIDKSGRIFKKHVGLMTYEDMEKYLSKMLGK